MKVRSEYNVSILVILRAVRHAYIITNNANHSYCQILGMRHQVDGCNENTIIRVYIVTSATLNNIQSKITKISQQSKQNYIPIKAFHPANIINVNACASVDNTPCSLQERGFTTDPRTPMLSIFLMMASRMQSALWV